MKLRELKIEQNFWGERKGQYTATLEFEDDKRSIQLELDEAATFRIMRAAMDEMVAASSVGADEFKQAILNTLQQ